MATDKNISTKHAAIEISISLIRLRVNQCYYVILIDRNIIK